MTNQEYIENLLKSQVLSNDELKALRSLRDRVENLLSRLDGGPRFYYGGSYGKDTIIRERYDLDVIAYWPESTTYTIKDIYDGVGQQLKKEWMYVNSKTVAWEIPFEGGFHIDVVPGRALDKQYREANLYRTNTGTTLKTSLKKHIDTIKDSGRREAVRLMKLWRERRKVPFKKSFLLELMTIAGCSGCSVSDLPAQVTAALKYIRDHIEATQVRDPANGNNLLSDDISSADKRRIKDAAQTALSVRTWSEVFEK
jgi:hypothetical protein